MTLVRIMIIFLFFLFLLSCNNNKKDNNFKESNETKSSFPEKNIKKDVFKKSGDTTFVKIYDDNGLLEKEGKFLNDTIKVGVWSFYEDGKLKNKREYLYYENSEYLNQFWLFDENEEVASGSFYEIIEIKEEYNIGDEILVEIFTPYKYFSDLDSELFLIYSTKEEFDKEFSNRNDINFDTIWSVKKSYPSKSNEIDTKFNLFFSIEPEKVGSFKASGVLIEQAEDFNENDSIIRYREMFLKIAFKVNDTVK